MAELLSRRTFLQSVAAAAAITAVPTAARAGDVGGGEIVRVAIHPAIGVARVGNSPDAFFFGPEVPGAVPSGPFKDSAGAMARQAARFRIYGYDRNGRVVCEITEVMADIEWRVRVGNAKAAWYGADEPLDLPQAAPMPQRNAGITNRRALAPLTPWYSVNGAAAKPVRLSGGTFLGEPVGFGEIATDESGRLVVLPGNGSAVTTPTSPPLGGFADNDGWTDTTCDGPVHATVRIGDRVFTAEPAWVLCGSPNFGPGIGSGIVTLYDTVLASLVLAKRRRRSRTEYHRDIAPIFARITDMQWVNEGYLTTSGFDSLRDWSSAEWQARLQDRSKANDRLRSAVFAMFRDPFFGEFQPGLEPQLYGDMVVVGATPPTNPRQWLAVSPVQYAHLRDWAAGNFTVGRPPKAQRIGEVPVSKQPATLDRAALDGCLGGAFHPGVEFPWLARTEWLWTDDMRLRADAERPNVRDYGDLLTPEVATSRTGPLSSIGPGDLVKWMGVPWQADSASCRFGYVKAISTVLPGFWPARIPNSVLTEQDYRVVMDTTRTLEERRAAFRNRKPWERFITMPQYTNTLSMMADEWSKLGVIVPVEGPHDAAQGTFPSRMLIEARVGFPPDAAHNVPAWAIREPLSLFPLIVTNSDDNSLRSVDAQGNVTVLPVTPAIGRPEGIALDPQGRLVVAAMDTSSVVRVAGDAVTTLGTMPGQPIGVAVDATGLVYACGVENGGWVSVIEANGEVTQLLNFATGANQPLAIAIAPDGALLIANNGDGAIARYDPLLRRMLNSTWIQGLARPKNMAWDSEGSLYIVERAANAVSKWNPQGARLPFTLQGIVLDGPFGIAYDGADALLVSSANPTANRIDRIALAGDFGTVSTFATGMQNPGGVVFQP